MLIEAAPDRFFDDDHYRGFAAVLVRLTVIDEAELDELLRAAWQLSSPKRLSSPAIGATYPESHKWSGCVGEGPAP